MKMLNTTAIVALMTATFGFSAIAPTYAQQPAPAQAQSQTQKAPAPNFRHHDQVRRGPGFGDLLSFERGAEAVEIALVRLSHAVDMTTEQQALFDTLKTDALTAAADFKTAVEALRSAAPAEGRRPAARDFSVSLDNRIAIETAHLAALQAVQPSFKAFFASLTDEQKTALAPQRPGRDGVRGMFGKGGPQHGGTQHKGPGPMGGPGAPPAPPAAPEAPATNG